MTRMQFCGAMLAIWLGSIVRSALADGAPLLSANTEVATAGETRPFPQLVRIVQGAIDKNDVKGLDGCLADHALKKGDYASLLRAVRVRAGVEHNLWFVRPAVDPYCHALYGAHVFQYFLIEDRVSGSRRDFRLLFQNAGDRFSIYPEQSHGLNDIEATGCIARECRGERMSFDGRDYRPVACSTTTWTDKDEEMTERRRCGSDGFRDDQSSGLEHSTGR